MKRGIRWLLWVLLGSAMETDALRKEARHRGRDPIPDGLSIPPTLCAFIRWVFQTDTKAGRAGFYLFCTTLMAWFVPHIVRGKETL